MGLKKRCVLFTADEIKTYNKMKQSLDKCWFLTISRQVAVPATVEDKIK